MDNELRCPSARAAFLAEASALLASSLDYETTLASVARLAVPHIADWCAVELIEEDPAIPRLAMAHVDPAKVALARKLQRRYPLDPNAPFGVPQVLRTGQPELYPDIPDALLVALAHDKPHLKILRRLRLTSAMIVPLQARGRVFGALTFIAAESGRHYEPADLVLAEDLAHRAATAVDNARLYREAQEALRARDQVVAELSERAREQAVIADLGHLALAGTALDTLMDEVVARVAQTLEVEYGEVMELLPGGNIFLLRAGVGWQAGYVGHATVSADPVWQPGYLLRVNGPMIVHDLGTETRFSGSPWLLDHGVASGLSVLIPGHEGPFGVLGVYTSRRQMFTIDHIHFLRAIANVLGTAIERRQIERLKDEVIAMSGPKLKDTLLRASRRMPRPVGGCHSAVTTRSPRI